METNELKKSNKQELLEVIENLQIRLNQIQNDFQLTKNEYDITTAEYLKILEEQKKAAEILHESEERYRTLVQGAYDIIHSVNNKGKFIFVNKAWKDIMEYTEEELSGLTIWDIISPESLSHCQQVFAQVMNGKSVEGIEVKFISKNGNSIILEGNITTRVLEGKVFASHGIFRDITDRKKTEEALRVSQQLLNSIIKTVPDIIYRLDAEGNITFINDTVKMYGYTPEKLIGKPVIDLVHTDDREKALYKINERRTGKRGTKSFKIRLLNSNNETIPFEVKSESSYEIKERVFLIDAEGLYNTDKNVSENFVGTQGIARDISEREELDKEKKKFKDQIFEVEKMESIGRLAGGIAHDFNNILTAILGYSEMLKIKYNDLSSSDGAAVSVIYQSAEKAANLTQQLLGFARKGKYNPVPLNINEIINERITTFKEIAEKKINIHCDFEEDINTIEADKNQIEHILMNLFVNSRDAMPNGGDVIFKTENIYLNKELTGNIPDFNPGNYVKISVTDTGTGITENTKKHLFEPFFTTKGTGKGSGLGLATVYGIIKNHNGHILCESEPGKGAAFLIYIPVLEKEIAQQEDRKKVIKNGKSILFVDDDELVRNVVKNQLEVLGHKVLAAQDGIEAVTLYERKKDEIGLVLLDMIMPNMDGRETFFKLKNIDNEVKILLMSGYSQDEKSTELLMEGAKGFIQKPFKLNMLSTVIKNILCE